MSLNSCHIIDLYVIFDLIIVLYICLLLLNETFYVNAINFVNVNVWLIILFCSFSIWDSHFNFVSICNSKIRIFVFEMNRISFKLIIVFMLNFFELLLKWINSYFVDENVISWRRNYVVKTSCNFLMFCNFLLCSCDTSTHLHYLQIQ